GPGRPIDDDVAAGAGGLRPFERGLGVAQQDGGRVTAAVVDRHPDADAQPDLLGAEAEGAHETLAHPLGDLLGVAGVVAVGVELPPAPVPEEQQGEGHERDEEERLPEAGAVGAPAEEPTNQVEADDHEEHGGAAGSQAPEVRRDVPASFGPSNHGSSPATL